MYDLYKRIGKSLVRGLYSFVSLHKTGGQCLDDNNLIRFLYEHKMYLSDDLRGYLDKLVSLLERYGAGIRCLNSQTFKLERMVDDEELRDVLVDFFYSLLKFIDDVCSHNKFPVSGLDLDKLFQHYNEFASEIIYWYYLGGHNV